MVGIMVRGVAWRLAMAVAALSAATAATAQSLTQTISGSELASRLQTALGPTTVHLHNFGPLKSASYHAANASSIKVPAALSGEPGQRTYFTLPDASTVLLGRRYGYYVDHVRSTGVFVTAGADAFTISITLASPGPALVGTCVRLKVPDQPCSALAGGVQPSVEWRDARIDIVAKPVVSRRSIALDIESVAISGDFDVGQACEWPLIGKRLCAALNRQSLRLRQKVAEQVKSSLNTPELRIAVAAAVREYLDTTLELSAFGVRRVVMQDGQLVIAIALGR